MSGVRVKYTAPLRNSRSEGANGKGTANEPRPSTSRLARLLALAHYIERLIEDGTLASHAETAKRLGVSRTRMAQVMKLLALSPEIQEAILGGEVEVSERALRPATTEVIWNNQFSRIFTRKRGPK